MTDARKESQAINGEIIKLRDPSDQANYAQAVGLIKDFSDSRPTLVDVEVADKGDEHVGIIKVAKDQTLEVLNIDNLTLPEFAHRLHARRINAKRNKLQKAA